MQLATFKGLRNRAAGIVALLGALAPPLAHAEEASVPTATPEAAPAIVPATTLQRIRTAGKLTLGYRSDARPFSFRDESGSASGYAVALCQHVADTLKSELSLPALRVEWKPVTAEARFRELAGGQVDLLCGPDTVTLTRRQSVSFSIAIFPGGVGALLRTDAPNRLRQVLSEGPPARRPLWRASADVLDRRDFAVVTGTTTENWLAGRITTFKLLSKTTPVADYDTGIRRVAEGESDVFFGDRAVLLDAVARGPFAAKLMVLDRHFTVEPLALALPRGDDDFRLAVDRALSRLYRSDSFPELFAKWFGAPDESARRFFLVTALPE